VAALAGIDLPLDRQPGLLVGTFPAPTSLRHVVLTPEVHLRPDGGGRLLLQRERLDGAISEGDTLAADGPLATEVMMHARQVLPALADVEPSLVKIGVRPMPRDGHPIVGFAPGVPGFYLAVTHSGITLSARLARLIAEDLTSGTCEELAPYRPSLFAERLSRPAGLAQGTGDG
jgi:glycine/D-amino acid oxidase-like deaminating enzyme